LIAYEKKDILRQKAHLEKHGYEITEDEKHPIDL